MDTLEPGGSARVLYGRCPQCPRSTALGHGKCPNYRGVLISGMSFKRGSTVLAVCSSLHNYQYVCTLVFSLASEWSEGERG